MVADKFQKLEEFLEAGCQKHIAAGGHITYGGLYSEENGYCPIWASIDREAALKLDVSSTITKMHYGLVQALGFKISEIDMLGFVNGFDGIRNMGSDKMIYKLGLKFREKYIKEEDNESDMGESETGDQS